VNDFDALYRELKGDVQTVADPLFDFAEQQLRKRGAFLPFGASLNRRGAVDLQAAWTGEEVTNSAEILRAMHARLRAVGADPDTAAVAVCEWVKITPEGGSQTDAVKVVVEHIRGLAVALYLPCRKRLIGGWQFGDTFALRVQPEILAWNADGAS